MPELPEVETTRQYLLPALQGQVIRRLAVREPRLRWAIPANLARKLAGQPVLDLTRRGKYLLLIMPAGAVLMHLGMSGSFRVYQHAPPPGKHEHFDLITEQGTTIRYRDPRRFGCLLWGGTEPLQHPLLCALGVEPLEDGFDADYLHAAARGRRAAVKPFIMDSRIVVGVGNIYASEALFQAGIHPARAAGRVAYPRYQLLVQAIRNTLAAAIKQGGTTLRDFTAGAGEAGYFSQNLNVYGRGGLPCLRCGANISRQVQGQRASYYCKTCQH